MNIQPSGQQTKAFTPCHPQLMKTKLACDEFISTSFFWCPCIKIHCISNFLVWYKIHCDKYEQWPWLNPFSNTCESVLPVHTSTVPDTLQGYRGTKIHDSPSDHLLLFEERGKCLLPVKNLYCYDMIYVKNVCIGIVTYFSTKTIFPLDGWRFRPTINTAWFLQSICLSLIMSCVKIAPSFRLSPKSVWAWKQHQHLLLNIFKKLQWWLFL